MLPIKKKLFYLNVNLGECPSPQASIMGFTASRSPLLPREWGWGDRGVSLPSRLSPSQLHPSKLTPHIHTACSVRVCVCTHVCICTPAHCREDSDGTSLHTVSSACLCHCAFSYFKQFYDNGETSATTSTKAAEAGFWHRLPRTSGGKCRLIGEWWLCCFL